MTYSELKEHQAHVRRMYWLRLYDKNYGNVPAIAREAGVHRSLVYRIFARDKDLPNFAPANVGRWDDAG